MAPRFPPSLEETISAYKNKFLIDLEDENDDAPILDTIPDGGRQSTDIYNEADIRNEQEDQSDGRGSGRGRKSKLPRDLAGLMGQANVSFARGEHGDAIIMCQEVIRLAPKCADPFISLAEYYQENDDEEKAEQLYLIAAYLQPSNVHLWVRVAESASKRKDFRLAATCYTKAIRADKNESSIVFHLKRCNLYEKLGDLKKALKGYENLISVLGPDDENGLELARGIARIYLGENNIDACIRTLEGALTKYPNQISSDDLCQLCSCYNSKEEFVKTIKLMERMCRFQLKSGELEGWAVLDDSRKDETEVRTKVVVITDQHNRLYNFRARCLLSIAIISMGCNDESICSIINKLDQSEAITYSLPLYGVANAYYSQKFYKQAKDILFKLTSQRDPSRAASIWLLYSQCLKNLNEIEEAISGYRKVLTYQPDDYSSKLALSNLLSVQGRMDEALEVTKQPLFTEKPVDIPLLYQSCRLLEQAEDWDSYCESAKALILTDMFYTKHNKEIMCMITSRSQKNRLENLKAVHKEITNSTLDGKFYRQHSIGEYRLDSKTMLETFLRYVEILFNVKKDYQELLRMSFSAYTCPALECYESSIDFYTAVACIIADDRDFTYNHLKILASRNPENTQLWNMLSLAMSNIYQDLRHGRFCLRQFLKNPDVLPLAIFNGHNALMSGSYKHALAEYINVFRERPNDPLIAFSIALTFLSLSCQRYVSSKYLCIFQMIAFLHTYLELRGTCQETMYNIGRAFHQTNMLDKAAIFYQKVLTMDDRARITPLRESLSEYDKIYDLRREAAFNLVLIYKNSQSFKLAHHVIKEYFRV